MTVVARTSSREPDAAAATTGRGVPVLAARYKTQLCRTFAAAGACRYGAECMFAHGAAELRSRRSNVEAGLVNADAVRVHQQRSTPATASSDGDLAAESRCNSGGALGFSIGGSGKSAQHESPSAAPSSSAASSSWVASSARGRARYLHDPYRAVPL